MRIKKWTSISFIAFAICSMMLVTSCKDDEPGSGSDTVGCNDPEANNSGTFDTDCDNCCTYDKDQFIGSYFGSFDCTTFTQLNSDSVTFEITEGFFSTADSVNVQIFTTALIIPTPSRVLNDSIYITTFIEDFEIDLGFGPQITDLEVTGIGVFDDATNTLTADLQLHATTFGIMDNCVFEGEKQ